MTKIHHINYQTHATSIYRIWNSPSNRPELKCVKVYENSTRQRTLRAWQVDFMIRIWSLVAGASRINTFQMTWTWTKVERNGEEEIMQPMQIWFAEICKTNLWPNSNKGPGWRWWGGQAQSWIDWLKAGCILAFDSVHFGCLIWDRCVFKHLAMGKVHIGLFRCFAPPPLSLLYNTIYTILHRAGTTIYLRAEILTRTFYELPQKTDSQTTKRVYYYVLG